MTRDDIIRMAKEACVHHVNFDAIYVEGLEEFAALVAEAERKECAAVADKHSEECYVGDSDWYEARNIAKAIRARGKK